MIMSLICENGYAIIEGLLNLQCLCLFSTNLAGEANVPTRVCGKTYTTPNFLILCFENPLEL